MAISGQRYFSFICIYCDVPGSPCLSKTGSVVGPYFSIFGSLSLLRLIIHSIIQKILKMDPIPPTCYFQARIQCAWYWANPSIVQCCETPPRWHATICKSDLQIQRSKIWIQFQLLRIRVHICTSLICNLGDFATAPRSGLISFKFQMSCYVKGVIWLIKDTW